MRGREKPTSAPSTFVREQRARRSALLGASLLLLAGAGLSYETKSLWPAAVLTPAACGRFDRWGYLRRNGGTTVFSKKLKYIEFGEGLTGAVFSGIVLTPLALHEPPSPALMVLCAAGGGLLYMPGFLLGKSQSKG